MPEHSLPLDLDSHINHQVGLAGRELNQYIRTTLSRKPRGSRTSLRRELQKMARRSLLGLAEELRRDPEAIWEIE